METVKVQFAKTHLSALLSRVQGGVEILIARRYHPVARLAPVVTRTERALGILDLEIHGSFFAPLPDGELDVWDGATS